MKIKIIDEILSKKYLYVVIFICWIFVGIVLSIFDLSLKNNYIYVLGVNSLLFIQIVVYHNLMKKENKISLSISGIAIDGHSIFLILSKLSNYLTKWYSYCISVKIGIIYIISLVLLKVLTWNKIITIYGSFTLILTVFIAIQLYLKYIVYILTLRKISNLDFKTFTPVSLHNPAESDWIVKFTDCMNSYSNYLGTLGAIYTLLFYLTTPLSAVSFSNNKLNIDTTNNIVFLITWGIIVILIGFGYILFDSLWKKYIKNIIKKIKRKRLLDYEESSTQQKLNRDYIELFNLYKNSQDFPELFNGKYINPLAYITIFINLYNVIISFLSQK